jgi:diphthamide synthase (EF-2-diphthine--ammonia ligase)
MKLKIGLRPGTKLSEHFDNRRDCYKVVEVDNVLGYVVSSGGRQSAAAIYPLYRADIHVKAGKIWHLVSSYEQGERLNSYTFHDDYEGCTFATIAAQAISALEERRHVQQLVKQVNAKKRRRK